MTELLGELARRLEANRNKALEKENRPRPPLANKKNLIPTRPASDTSNAKGKQREKVAISPAVSTVLEESMSQGMAGMLLNSGESYLRQPSGRDVLVPNDTNTAASGATTIRLAQPGTLVFASSQ